MQYLFEHVRSALLSFDTFSLNILSASASTIVITLIRVHYVFVAGHSYLCLVLLLVSCRP